MIWIQIDSRINEYGLRKHATPEELEMRFYGNEGKTILYGDRVLVAGHFWMGSGRPSYYGAVYEFLSDDHSCEGEIGLRAVSEVEHIDEGHAIEWAMAGR